ncbi:hypothetical protein LTR22_013537 [Elasticomyces elasticus]|nr:hypothetical protein LTR22_013537 [Elasticomyces elasticus]KAK4922415.1 hypothetical protein LTR49_010280 [Elasticomyces elasticus]KAK5765297.1 hypothetical protein LTS12_004554 [Elasticomyces elasticus]
MPHSLVTGDSKHTNGAKFDLHSAANQYIYASKVRHRFQFVIEEGQSERQSDSNTSGPALSKLWLGLALKQGREGTLELGFVCHDGTDWSDFAVHELCIGSTESPHDAGSAAQPITDHIVSAIREYERRHRAKFVGAGISSNLASKSPGLSERLWAELDILPIVLPEHDIGLQADESRNATIEVDEVANVMAKQCITYFGPSGLPATHYGQFNNIQVDVAGRASHTSLERYARTVDDRTMRAAKAYAHSLRLGHKSVAFFTATSSQGGESAMRHALLRFLGVVGVESMWYVVVRSIVLVDDKLTMLEVLRVLETNERILLGTARPGQRFTNEQQQIVQDWVVSNAERLWVSDGCPLAPRFRGGASVIVIDDPHMAVLVTIAKRLDPQRPVIYRSHIDIKPELVVDPSSNTAQVLDWVWSHAGAADTFIGHPVKDVLSQSAPKQALGYMPATSDWQDGRNKSLSDRDVRYYLQEFNEVCHRQHTATLAYPGRDYILQIAPFDSPEATSDALAAYAAFRHHSRFCAGKTTYQTPQLVMCAQYSASDSEQRTVLHGAVADLHNDYPDLVDSVIIAHLRPHDQIINALLSCARVVLQLSTHLDSEITASQALKKGVPVIARDTGAFPLLVHHNVNGFLVHGLDHAADITATADYIDALFVNEEKYEAMSAFASKHISSESGTVGNAMCWMYLLDRLASGHKVAPDGQWISDMAREFAGEPVGIEEVRLARR